MNGVVVRHGYVVSEAGVNDMAWMTSNSGHGRTFGARPWYQSC